MIGRREPERFFASSGFELSQVYDAGGWTHLRRLAGFVKEAAPAGEEQLNRKFETLLQLFQVYATLLVA